MVFSSPLFLFLFLPIVLGVYFIIPRIMRNMWLLIVSMVFYAWGEHIYTQIMIASMVLNYFAGLLIDRFRGRSHEKLVLAIGIIANLGILIFYKYSDFLVGNLNSLLVALHKTPLPVKHTHLPVGISFFTFHAISYLIDVSRGDAKVQKNPLNFALYESLFPQLVAGPIIRYQDIADRIDHRVETLPDFAYGIIRFITGLSKKVLIANILAVAVDKIFALGYTDLSMGVAWFGIICYALQIYFDFSGYSDMAVGLGYMFGFRFVENFNYPYISRSIQEFWRRWHISLSTWFRDYLYIPLGGNRVSTGRIYFNLLVVFFLCGLWHGASWNFVIWGLLHGLFLVLERQTWMRWLDRAWMPVRHLYALVVILVGWVFFRADNLPAALAYLHAMSGFGAHVTDTALRTPAVYLDLLTGCALCAGIIGSTPIMKWLGAKTENDTTWYARMAFGRLIALSVMFLLCAIQLASGTYNPFIYFRF